MKEILKIFSILFSFVIIFTSCKDDLLLREDSVERQDNLDVEIISSIDRLGTRGPGFAKTDFDQGDIIHVQGNFVMSDNNKVTKYGAFKYDGSKWTQYYGANDEAASNQDRFSWPNNAETADFIAYYFKKSNSLLVPDDPENIKPITLSEIAGTSSSNPDSDPLYAELSGIKYGHTIYFAFKHACAHLTIEDIPGGVSSVLWFTRQNGEEVAPDFYNAFKLYLNEDKKLCFNFVQSPDPNFENKVYVEGSLVTPKGSNKSSASFFLAPGQYLNFLVGYPGASSMIDYFSYSKKINQLDGFEVEGNDSQENGQDKIESGDIEGNIDGQSANPYNILKANGVYTFNVEKSSGVTIDIERNPNIFDETDDPIYDVDAGRFLWAVCKNEKYVYEKDDVSVVILEPNGNTSQLMKHVNMQWAEYTIFPPEEYNGYTWFEPSLGQGKTFDGGGKYIWNLGSPLFREVKGDIKNLGIANANINTWTQDKYTIEFNSPEEGDSSSLPTYPAPSDSYDLSRQGALCGFLNGGNINTLSIKAQKPLSDTENRYEAIFKINARVLGFDSQEAHNVGCLIGSCSNASVNNVIINCDMELNVENYNDESHVPKLSIGGIIGQNSKSQILNLGPGIDKDPVIKITNLCNYNKASYFIGGIVGSNSGDLQYITLNNVLLSSLESKGQVSMIGGLVGDMSSNDGGLLINCNIGAGSIIAGKSAPTDEGNGVSYIGGIAGQVNEVYIVERCSTNVDVLGAFNRGQYKDIYTPSGVVYATGGIFGIISLPSSQQGKNGSLYQLQGNAKQIIGMYNGDQEFLGYFAGKVPDGRTWENDYKDNDIDCRVVDYVIPPNFFEPLPPIGSENKNP